ncbi:MAG: hypothetical protein LBB29_01655 [Holosporaceae bacterium]|nr:hypothetical protein [Holosporaceae bacterium]
MLLRLSTPDINRTPPNVVLHSPPQNDDVNEESESSDYLEDNESRDDSPSNESSEDFQGKKENYSKSKKLSYPIALKRTSRSFFSHTKWIKVNSGQMQNGKSINTPMQNIPEEFKYFVAPENSNEALYFYSEDSGHTEILNSENNINNNSKEESVISSNSWKEEQDDDDVSRYYTPPLFYTNSQGIVNN